jgi:predicted AlkP superfamily pyrophosphatase or phosphodiesterase
MFVKAKLISAQTRLRFFVAVLCILLGFTSRLSAQPTTRPVPEIKRVTIISIDGLRPDVLLRADAPNLRDMCRNGAFTFWARTTAQSITLPSHVSMLTGVVPETHAILWNSDLPFSEPVYPSVPTIFELAHREGYTTAMVAGKSKFTVLNKPGTIDWAWVAPTSTSEDPDEMEAAAQILREHRPDVFFVHFPSVDNIGHLVGWGTEQQLAAVSRVDGYIGQLVAITKELKLDDQTLFIVSADHGGAGRTHGPDDPRSRTIPWIVYGPGVRKNFDLTRLGKTVDIQTFDTFATTAAVLGIPIREKIDGVFVKAAFENQELLISTYRPSMKPATQP